jgi:CTP:molybdopterin cytidylyltransferase MocA
VILKKNLKDAINVEISSNEIILDLDTIEDYGNIKKYVSN